MNNLRRGCLGILALLITVTLSACSEGQGGIHVCFLLCLWRKPRGVPLYLGDGGDSGDENHNLLGGFTAADRGPQLRAVSQTECQD